MHSSISPSSRGIARQSTALVTSHAQLSVRERSLVCEDPASQALRVRMAKIAPSDAPVLIFGETGTGKELVARQLHALSQRAKAPFVAFNAGAVSEALAESELFGHEKGAFTGATARKAGWFEAADGGTLFLDEIGDLPLALQVKLLRVLQEGEVTPIGARVAVPVNVRVIAATNVDLRAALREKRFRDDLFYRLNVASLSIRPLRERPSDIVPLARHFLARYEQKQGRSGLHLCAGAIERLLSHDWPGNVRELENAVHNAVLVCSDNSLTAADFELGTCSQAGPAPLATDLSALEAALVGLIERGVPNLPDKVQHTLLSTAYRYADGNQLATARVLGMTRNVIRARLIEHGIIPANARVSLLPRHDRAMSAIQSATLRIGFQQLGLLMVAKAHGALEASFAQRGVRVEWVEYASGLEIVQALSTNELAAGIVGDCPAIFAQAQAVPIVYLAAEPPAPRGTALVVPNASPVARVQQLRGKRVAVNRAAQAHYLLLRSLEEAGIDEREIDICFASPASAFEAFKRGEVDAWSVWDPWLSTACVELGARVLRDSTGLMPNSAYYLARRDYADQHPELIGELLNQVGQVASWVERDPARAADLMAPRLGMSPRALLASLSRALRAEPLDAHSIAEQQQIADGLLRLRWIQSPVSVIDAQWRSS
jgi:aliphatic sulfonates family ABC transporter substrate-binding protein